MTFTQFLITYWKYILSAAISGCFLIVNIIQAIRSHDKTKLKDAICRLPEFICAVEALYKESTLPADQKSTIKKAACESILIANYGDKFVKKYISVFDDAIEDILETPQKKGGSDGVSKENA